MADRLPLPHILAAVIQPKLNCSLGYELPSSDVRVTSGLPPIADMRKMSWQTGLCQHRSFNYAQSRLLISTIRINRRFGTPAAKLHPVSRTNSWRRVPRAHSPSGAAASRSIETIGNLTFSHTKETRPMVYWILILLLQDPSHQSHVVRVAAYNTEATCKQRGKELADNFGNSSKYVCVQADLPN
jgi:hypothetical protein